ncbi:MAG: TorF family putative porin [Opitutaceae bacterium]
MKKKITFALVGIIAGGLARAQAPAPAAAAAPAAAPAVSFTATGTLVSDYMFRGQRLSSAAFQPAVEGVAGDLTFGVWASKPFDGKKVPDSSDPEIDLYGSYSIALGKDLSLVPGVTAYFYPSAPTAAGFYRSTFEPSLAFNYTVEGVKFTPKVYYDIVLDGATWEFTAAYAVPMKDIGSELGLTATYGTFLLNDAANGSSPAVKSWGNYWLIGLSMPFQVSKESKIVLGLQYTKGSDAYTKQGTFGKSVNSLAVGKTVGTIGYSFSF